MREYLLHWPCSASSRTVFQRTFLRQSETIFYLFLFQGKHEFFFTYQILSSAFDLLPNKSRACFHTAESTRVPLVLGTNSSVGNIYECRMSFLSGQISTFRTTVICLTLISAPLLIPLTSYHNLFFFFSHIFFNCIFSKSFSSFSLLLPEHCFEVIPGFLYSILTDRLVIFLQPLLFLSVFFHPTPSNSLYSLMLSGIMIPSNHPITNFWSLPFFFFLFLRSCKERSSVLPQ